MSRFLINKCYSQHADTVAQGTNSRSFHIPCATAPRIPETVMTDRRWDCSLNLIKEVQALRIAKLCVRPIIRMASDVYQVQKFAN